MSVPIVSFCRIETFSAAHRLHNPQLSDEENARVFGKCNNVNGHGHNYQVEVTVRGPVDPVTGMVLDLAVLKKVMGEVLELVDHRHLDRDVPHFEKIVSTTENVTVFIWQQMIQRLEKPSLLHKVTVFETPKNKFSYRGEKRDESE